MNVKQLKVGDIVYLDDLEHIVENIDPMFDRVWLKDNTTMIGWGFSMSVFDYKTLEDLQTKGRLRSKRTVGSWCNHDLLRYTGPRRIWDYCTRCDFKKEILPHKGDK